MAEDINPGAAYEWVIDPIDGTRLLSLGLPNSVSVVALSERGTMYAPGPIVYMNKIAVGHGAKDAIDIEAPVKDNLENIANAYGKGLEELTVVVLDRPRHKELIDQIRAAGAKAMVRTQGGSTVLSFPLPAPVNDVMVNATVRKDASLVVLDPAALKELVGTYIVRVETTGAVTSDTTYAEYGDWNWDDYQADIMIPRRIVRKSGDTTLELTTINTNTYNPYVVMPVPANIGRQGGAQ
jgi:fructose-1,6-bisphosphatase II